MDARLVGSGPDAGLAALPRPPRPPASRPPRRRAAGLGRRRPIRHVFVIVLENESASTTFGPGLPRALSGPDAARRGRLRAQLLRHRPQVSNDNYIAMISGQAPNAAEPGRLPGLQRLRARARSAPTARRTATGCVYPAAVQTIASQLTAAGFTWRDYNEEHGRRPDPRGRASAATRRSAAQDNTQNGRRPPTSTPPATTRSSTSTRSSTTPRCATPTSSTSTQLPQDLASPAAATANYVFITPDLCDDGHDAPCANGQPGGPGVRPTRSCRPGCRRSPARRAFQQDGLLIITFDEAATSDTSSCCGEIPGPGSPQPGVTGPGGGDVGAVLLSPCIAPGTVTQTAYNHYSMLGSVEDLFGLSHLGYAALPGETHVRLRHLQPAVRARRRPRPRANAPRLLSARLDPRARSRCAGAPSPRGGTSLAAYTVQVAITSARASELADAAWPATRQSSLSFRGTLGHTYAFQRYRPPTWPVRPAPPQRPRRWCPAACARPAATTAAAGGPPRPRRLAGPGDRELRARGASFTLRYRGGIAGHHRRAHAAPAAWPGSPSTAAPTRSASTPCAPDPAGHLPGQRPRLAGPLADGPGAPGDRGPRGLRHLRPAALTLVPAPAPAGRLRRAARTAARAPAPPPRLRWPTRSRRPRARQLSAPPRAEPRPAHGRPWPRPASLPAPDRASSIGRIRSIGIGKTIVEFWLPPISRSVCR